MTLPTKFPKIRIDDEDRRWQLGEIEMWKKIFVAKLETRLDLFSRIQEIRGDRTDEEPVITLKKLLEEFTE